jgi:hypothetical protein
MDLVRELLITIEDRPSGSSGDIAVEGYDRPNVAYHLALLHEAGLINGRVDHVFGDPIPRVIVERLSWSGHEFLDAARNQTVWARTKAIVREKGGDIPFAVLRELLVSTTRQVFGVG